LIREERTGSASNTCYSVDAQTIAVRSTEGYSEVDTGILGGTLRERMKPTRPTVPSTYEEYVRQYNDFMASVSDEYKKRFKEIHGEIPEIMTRGQWEAVYLNEDKRV